MNNSSEQETINMNLTLDEFEKWQESWLQPSLLTIELQKQLAINRRLSIALMIASAAFTFATLFKFWSCP